MGRDSRRPEGPESSGTALPTLLTTVNADDSDYAYIESERLGRTSSKGQHAYFYDQSTVALTAPGATYPEPEGTDPFHRQPFIAPFAARDGTFDGFTSSSTPTLTRPPGRSTPSTPWWSTPTGSTLQSRTSSSWAT